MSAPEKPPYRRLSEEERALWARVSAAARRLEPGAACPAPGEEAGSASKQGPEKAGAKAKSGPERAPERGSAPRAEPGPGLDRRSATRLKRGHYPIEAALDLHGHTQGEAHRALEDFLAGSAARGLRCVLVVTGKGRGGAEGVLRAALPRWLEEPRLRALVLAMEPAKPRHGGGGAFYVLLRRQRKSAVP